MKTEIRTTFFSMVTALVVVLVSSFFANYITRAEFDSERIKSAAHESQVVTELKNINSNLEFMKREFIEHIKNSK